MDLIKARLYEAKHLVLSCVGRLGIYAGTHRYRYQCWTRDLAYSIDALLNLGQDKAVKTQLLNIANKQTKSGKVPIAFIENKLGFIRIHLQDLIRNRRGIIKQIKMSRGKVGFWNSFRIASLNFENISPWTMDGEMLFIIASMRYFERTRDKDFLYRIYPHLNKALKYAETHNMNKDGFIVGGDWRDIDVSLDNCVLLINNVLLYRAYVVMEENDKAAALKKRINSAFWTGSYYRDRLGSDDFDTLGQSWAVLYDVVPKERYASVSDKYKSIDSANGLKINDNVPDRSLIDPSVQAFTDQFGTIWPFITGSGILALIKMGSFDFAKEQFIKWSKLKGFSEWYNAHDGSGLGDREQLWSAALYVIVSERMSQKDMLKITTGLTINDYINVVPILNFDPSVR